MRDGTRTNGRVARLIRLPFRLVRYPLALLRRPLGALGRILLDAIVLALWVLALTAVFLTTGWPGWWFYAALLGGAVLYTLLTSGWWTGGTSSD